MNILKLFSLFLLLSTAGVYSQTTIKHKITKGESVSLISKKYKVSEAEIYQLNPTIKDKYLQLNATLLIPINNLNSENILGNEIPLSHKVVAGETLNIIAEKYHLKLSALQNLNPSIDARRLKIGAVLKLSETISTNTRDSNTSTNLTSTESFQPTSNFELKTHIIKSGETLKLIAKKYKLSVHELRKLNPKVEPRKLKIGTIITLNKPDPLSLQEIKKDSSVFVYLDETKDLLHKVLPNETKFGIAKKYDISVEILNELNPEVANNLLVDYFLIIKKGTNSEVLTSEIIEKSRNAEITSVKIEILIDEASKKIGTPYRSGGTSNKGFDCSGLIYTTFKEINMYLPRSSRNMGEIGTKISKAEAKIGDLIFFATNRKGTISHVGMITEIIGDEIKFIHSSTSLGVIISSIKEAYYLKRFVQIKRVL